MMTREEWNRLKGFMHAKRNAPWTNNVGRRHVKGRAAGTGQMTLKHARIIPGVSVERVFINHGV